MSPMELICALDLLDGGAVRLERGDYERRVAEGLDPLELVESWVSQGARRLHVVDLEGARRGTPSQLPLVARIVERVRALDSDVVVELGGGLREYMRAGRAVLDGYPVDAMCRSGRGQLLVPWPNRLRHGSYEFGGRRHQLPLTEPENGNAIHGLVRWARWNAVEREPHRIVLAHTIHPQPGYPFALALRVEYALAPDGISVRIRAKNVGRGACPYGAGAHPYLTLGTSVVDPVELCVPASTVLYPDDDGIATRPARVEGTEFDFRSARPIGATKLDNAFTDLERGDDGLARIELRHGKSGLAVWMDETCRYAMVFTGDPLPDVNRRSLAVEPMTCPPNAFRSGEDVLRLEPGGRFEGRWGIRRR